MSDLDAAEAAVLTPGRTSFLDEAVRKRLSEMRIFLCALRARDSDVACRVRRDLLECLDRHGRNSLTPLTLLRELERIEASACFLP